MVEEELGSDTRGLAGGDAVHVPAVDQDVVAGRVRSLIPTGPVLYSDRRVSDSISCGQWDLVGVGLGPGAVWIYPGLYETGLSELLVHLNSHPLASSE